MYHHYPIRDCTKHADKRRPAAGVAEDVAEGFALAALSKSMSELLPGGIIKAGNKTCYSCFFVSLKVMSSALRRWATPSSKVSHSYGYAFHGNQNMRPQ